MKMEVDYSKLIDKINKILSDIFGDKLPFILYDEDEQKFIIADESFDDCEDYSDDANPYLIEMMNDLKSFPELLDDIVQKCPENASDISLILSLSVEDLFIINDNILKPAGHKFFGNYNYNQLTDYEYDNENDILTLEFKMQE